MASVTDKTDKRVGGLATEAVAAYLQKAESYTKAVIKDRDPEDLHQMRVNLRRLRTVMQVFAPSIQLPQGGNERQVARLSRRLGTLRDLDVITATLAEQYVPDLPDPERAALVVIFDYLAKKRQAAYKAVKAALKGDRYATLRNRLHQWAAAPRCNDTARLPLEAVLPDLTLPLVSHLWLHPGWLVGTQGQPEALQPDRTLDTEAVAALVSDRSSALHSLRKQVKRVRYQLKFVAEYYGDRLEADLTKLADLQDVLGNLQDSLVLEHSLQKALPDWQTALPTLKSLLADRRHRAWKQWQTHQQFYLARPHREALRQILLMPGVDVAPPVSKAAATKKTAAATTTKKTSSKAKGTGAKGTTTNRKRPKETPPPAADNNNGAA